MMFSVVVVVVFIFYCVPFLRSFFWYFSIATFVYIISHWLLFLLVSHILCAFCFFLPRLVSFQIGIWYEFCSQNSRSNIITFRLKSDTQNTHKKNPPKKNVFIFLLLTFLLHMTYMKRLIYVHFSEESTEKNKTFFIISSFIFFFTDHRHVFFSLLFFLSVHVSLKCSSKKKFVLFVVVAVFVLNQFFIRLLVWGPRE